MSMLRPVEAIRADFPAFESTAGEAPPARFDGPGGTQVPRLVIDAVADYLARHNANAHWHFPASERTDALVAAAREAFAAFGRSLARRELLPLQSMVLGWIACWHERHERRPVQAAAFRLFLALRKRQLAPLDELEPLLAEIAGARPTYWRPYDHLMPYDARTKDVLAWLAKPAAERPRLVTVYFHAVDSAAHMNGVGSEAERNAIAEVDAQVGALVAGVEALGLADKTNFIVVSDHGMTNVSPDHVVNLDDYISFDDVFIPELEGPEGAGHNAVNHIFVEHGDIDGVYAALAAGAAKAPFSVWKREDLPADWRMNNPDRTGDIVAVADEGWLLFGKSVVSKYPTPALAQHGYDRRLPSMSATFIADGPRFADGLAARPFDNVEVYGIIADILGVDPAETDGDIAHVRYFMTPAD